MTQLLMAFRLGAVFGLLIAIVVPEIAIYRAKRRPASS